MSWCRRAQDYNPRDAAEITRRPFFLMSSLCEEGAELAAAVTRVKLTSQLSLASRTMSWWVGWLGRTDLPAAPIAILNPRIVAERIQVVSVLVAADDRQQASSRDIGDAVDHAPLVRGSAMQAANRSTMPSHPITSPHPCNRTAYKRRNLVERAFCRIKDFRRVATRYDKLAATYAAAISLAAIVTWWI